MLVGEEGRSDREGDVRRFDDDHKLVMSQVSEFDIDSVILEPTIGDSEGSRIEIIAAIDLCSINSSSDIGSGTIVSTFADDIEILLAGFFTYRKTVEFRSSLIDSQSVGLGLCDSSTLDIKAEFEGIVTFIKLGKVDIGNTTMNEIRNSIVTIDKPGLEQFASSCIGCPLSAVVT